MQGLIMNDVVINKNDIVGNFIQHINISSSFFLSFCIFGFISAICLSKVVHCGRYTEDRVLELSIMASGTGSIAGSCMFHGMIGGV